MLKFSAMRESSFRFLRGTCHLYYAGVSRNKLLPDSPATWLCGDLHLENFGSFRGSDKEVYFDLNDFDEGILGPALWDLSRLMTSIRVAGNNARYKEDYIQSLLDEIVKGYRETLQLGKPVTIEQGTAKGIIRSLLDTAAGRKEKRLVKERAAADSDYSLLHIDNRHLFKPTAADKKQLIATAQEWLDNTRGKNKRKILDLAFMVAGTGSIGIKRYLLLALDTVREKKYLLSVKQALPSSLQPYVVQAQPDWQNEAERITAIQQRMQHVSPGGLGFFSYQQDWYVSRWVQPIADKISLDYFMSLPKEQLSLMHSLGQLTASAQLRSSGRNKSSTADELIAFGTNNNWQKPLLSAVTDIARQTEEDYTAFCRDYDAGFFTSNKK